MKGYPRAFVVVVALVTVVPSVGPGSSRPITALVTHELLPVLGVAPLMGRAFTYEDTLPGAEDVGILSSERWWR